MAEAAVETSAAPAATSSVGIINPPPEIRNIVNKTAGFVAKNGWDFADRIRKEKAGEVKFNFLQPDNPYHAYFVHMVEEVRSGRNNELGNINLDQVTLDDEMEEDAKTVKPPPEAEFMDDPPTLSAQDLDVIKLTAQYVARNGTEFLQTLMQKEARNFQFDFLKPTHLLFNYFTKLTEQYRKILLPRDDMLEKLRRVAKDPLSLVPEVEQMSLYKKQTAEDRQRRAEEQEREKREFNSIDWHDFVVVATIEFGPDDKDLPPPVTAESLGIRMVQLDQLAREGYSSRTRPTEAEEAPAKDEAAQEDSDVEMEVDDDMDMDDDTTPATVPGGPIVASANKPGTMPAQMATSEEPVKIREYDPKAKKPVQKRNAAGELLLESPITGELIPESQMAEHMRVNLLDPKWREDKARQEEEARKRQEMHQLQGSGTMQHLKGIAAKRTDIFGAGDVETEIGRQVGAERERPDPNHPTWDGTPVLKGKDEVARSQARALAEQSKAAAAATSGTGETQPLNIPPNMQPTNYPPNMQPPSQPAPTPMAAPPLARPPPLPSSTAPAMAVPPPTSAPAPAPRPAYPPPPTSSTAPPNLVGGLNLPPATGGAPRGMYPPPSSGAGTAAAPAPAPAPGPTPTPTPAAPAPAAPVTEEPQPAAEVTSEPPAKKTKADTVLSTLVPEEEFLQTHSGNVTVTVQADDEAAEGRSFSVTLPYTATVGDLKSELQTMSGLAKNKQKLTLMGMAFGNSNTLAFYNLESDSPVQLTLKTRGGRK
ncbi:uncharacterized protein MONBRDRAFT_33566 [Monosiga brevicollis MX1]|uniref:Splicing factor 3A subunit 1 n=1 Tax=Monosiga brevicollis TaxID=81824 RepID=A9V640_MONBE|nr:uncharacterized protein MONBRDRAFT_33566 [Monosiga brevicollis MX1]EDQ86920.1 predicted protein [Monosiga brevicollis MX1]|eukprot:XP_001748159.1 hypothetical protein [Monosiga brevicollis MX1]